MHAQVLFLCFKQMKATSRCAYGVVLINRTPNLRCFAYNTAQIRLTLAREIRKFRFYDHVGSTKIGHVNLLPNLPCLVNKKTLNFFYTAESFSFLTEI